ncbi:MAG: mechanosensitive ion channel family protein [Pseudomonadota bacterium]
MTGEACPVCRPIFLVLLLMAMLSALPGAAQSVFDYGQLLGSSPAETEEPQAQSSPRQSVPAPSFDPGSVPSAEAYGSISETYAPDMFNATQRYLEIFRTRLASILLEAPDALGELNVTLAAASRTGQPSFFLGVAIFAMVLLAVGRAIAHLMNVYAARPFFVGLQKATPRGYHEKIPVLGFRVAITAVGITLAVSAASAIGLFYHDGHEATLQTALVIFACYAATLMMDTIWRMILCPFLPNYRIPQIDSSEARQLYRWLSFTSGFGAISLGFTYWVEMLGLPRPIVVLFSVGLSGVLIVFILLMMRTNAGTINRIILDGKNRAEINWVTLLTLTLWAPLALLYLLATWGKFAVERVMGVDAEPLGLVVPYLVLLGGTMIYAFACFAIERAFERRRMMRLLNARPETQALPAGADAEQFGAAADVDGDGEDEGGTRAPEETEDHAPLRPRRGMQSFEELARRVASLFAIGTGAYGLLYYWGGAGIFQETMALGIAEDVIDIVFIGYIAFHAIRIWIDRKIAEEGADEAPLEPGEGEGGGSGASRVATLLPLVRSFVLGIIIIAIMLALAAELGLNVAPLFAGAGIVGLAIGFGSQTLVRDILSGAFFLMDDAFRRGEYIDVGEVKGTVEKISLRSFQLRHHLGMLHTIPFGEIKHLTNFSRDWVMMKLPLRLTYDTDVEKVRKLVKKLGLQLMEDETIGDKFLQPLKSQGVIEMQDSAMIVRVKFMTKPGEQWVIRKRVYQEIRDLFEREGIKFAHREVTVRLPDLPQDRPLSEDEARAIGSAARASVDLVESQALAAGGARGPIDPR